MRRFWITSLLILTFSVSLSLSYAQEATPPIATTITPENAAQVEPIARLGSGTFTSAAAYNPVTDQLAVGGSIGLWLYDGLDLAAAPDFIDLDRWVIDAEYSSDGRYLAYTTSGGSDSTGTVIDAATRETVLEIPDAQRIAFRPNSDELMVATWRYDPEVSYYPVSPLEVWDFRDGERLLEAPEVRVLPQYESFGYLVTQMEYSPDGAYFAATFQSYAEDSCNQYTSYISLWDVDEFDAEPEWLSDAVSFAFHPTEPVMIAAYHSGDGIGSGASLKVWNYQALTVTDLLMPGIDSETFWGYDIMSIAFTEEGSAFTVLTFDQAWTWEYGQPQPAETVGLGQYWRQAQSYLPLPDADRWLIVGARHLAVGAPGSTPFAAAALPVTLVNVRFSPQGDGFVSLSPTNERRLWRLNGGELERLATVAPDAEILFGDSRALYADGNVIRAFDLATGAELMSLTLESPVLDVALNDAGTYMAFRAVERAEVWRLDAAAREEDLLSGGTSYLFTSDQIESFGFVQESNALWVRSRDTAGEEQLSLIQLHQGSGWSYVDTFGGYPSGTQIVISPQSDYYFLSRPVSYFSRRSMLTDVFYYVDGVGMQFGGSFEGGSIRFIDDSTFFSTQYGQGLSEPTTITQRRLPDFETVISSVWYGGNSLNSPAANVISPDATRILTFEVSQTRCGGDFHFVSLWDVAAETTLWFRVQGVRYPAVFTPNSDVFALSSYDTPVLYAAHDGALLVTLPGVHTDAITNLQFSADGSRLYSASLDGTIRVWGVGTRY